MPLPTLLHELPRELSRLHSSYELAARPHRWLDPYPILPRLLEGLRRTVAPSTASRQALVASLLRVHQTSPSPVWSTVLLHVFTPTIKKVRKKLLGGDPETRDAILVEAFHEALVRVRTDDPARIFMYVRQEFRRRAFRALKDVTAWEEIGFGTEADLEPDPDTVGEPLLLGIWLERQGTPAGDAELLSTVLDHGALQALILNRHGNLDDAGRARAYACLQKRRRRLLLQLRAHLRAEATG